jgi:hypothetical protein
VFLVRIGSMFFTGFDKKARPLAVPTPSTALHMTYARADGVCQKLRDMNFENVCVTDRLGRYADLEVIEQEIAVRS